MALSRAASELTCVRIRHNAQALADLADAYLKCQADAAPETGVIADMDTRTLALVAEMEVATVEQFFNYNQE